MGGRHTEEKTPRRRGVNVTTEAGIGVMWPQAREPGSHQELEDARSRFSPITCGGSVALLTPGLGSVILTLDFWPPEL